MGSQRLFGKRVEIGTRELPSALAILKVREIRKGGLIKLGAAKGRNGLGTASLDCREVHQQSPNIEPFPTAWYFLARKGEGGF